MQRSRTLKRTGLAALVIAVAATAFGIASVVNAAGHPVGDVWYGSGETSSGDGSGTVIASVTVPTGNYMVTASGWAAGLSAGLKDVRCYINTPQADANDAFLAVGQDTVSESGQEAWAISQDVVVASIAAHVITASCLTSSSGDDVLYGARLTALKAGNVYGQTFAPVHSPAGAPATPSN